MKYLMYIGQGRSTAVVGDTVTVALDGVKKVDNPTQPEYPYYTACKITETDVKSVDSVVPLRELERLSQVTIDDGEALFQVHVSGIAEENYKSRRYGSLSFGDMIMGCPAHIDLRMKFGGSIEQFVLTGTTVRDIVERLYSGGEINIGTIITKNLEYYDEGSEPVVSERGEIKLVQKKVTHMLSRWVESDAHYSYLGYLSSNTVTREVVGDSVRYLFGDGQITGTFALRQYDNGWKFVVA